MSKKGDKVQGDWPKVIGLLVALGLMAGFLFLPLRLMIGITLILLIVLIFLKINHDAKNQNE